MSNEPLPWLPSAEGLNRSTTLCCLSGTVVAAPSGGQRRRGRLRTGMLERERRLQSGAGWRIHLRWRLCHRQGPGKRRAWRWPKLGMPKLQGIGGVPMRALVLSSWIRVPARRRTIEAEKKATPWFNFNNNSSGTDQNQSLQWSSPGR